MTDDQLEAFEGQSLEALPPDKRMHWYCTRCGSELVYGISMLDTKQRYAIAARCGGCRRERVTVQRELPPPPKEKT